MERLRYNSGKVLSDPGSGVIMNVWDSYPENYRSAEIQEIVAAVQAGECISLIGLSGAGKSNLLGYLVHRSTPSGIRFIHVDCNYLSGADPTSLFTAILEGLDALTSSSATLQGIIKAVRATLETTGNKLCFIFDRFELFDLSSEGYKVIANNLRALRDNFKYELTYILSMRHPLEPENELAELFLAHTLWLGPLTTSDAKWSVQQYAGRHELQWNDAITEKIVSISGGYPSMLRAVCEAASAGIPFKESELRKFNSVERRLDEFWADAPDDVALKESRLQELSLFQKVSKTRGGNQELTAAEQRLLDHLKCRNGEICSKEELIEAVWPEEKLSAGLRDDSLTQLVHRLREKIDRTGKITIQTLPGRGYRFNG